MADLHIRVQLEDKENCLSEFAAKSSLSRGRRRAEEPSPMRTEFQRDRDRILYSNAFRRLKHKTQVFIAPTGDHYVTRLTHTLEVSQIARTISRALNLNEDLTEAIALGHDLGHTPFGHIGEDMLNELNPSGFRHYKQSLRIVDILEKSGKGLNLTWEVRDGIVNHSKSFSSIFGNKWGKIGTLEGQVVKIADIVAYINHDTSDAIRAGLIVEQDLPRSAVKVLGQTSSDRINTLVMDIVSQSLKEFENTAGAPDIKMSKPVLNAANSLRDFLFERVYKAAEANGLRRKARSVITFLYEYFYAHREKIPHVYGPSKDNNDRVVTDYIAGMTDQFALLKVREIKTGRKIAALSYL
jgi:dGTPase